MIGAAPHSVTDTSQSPHTAIERLSRLMADDMQAVDDTIISRMHSQVPLIPELAGHLVRSGGKRLRPLLTLACAHMLGHQERRHIPLAATIEFIHTATLLHDDVVDESGMRRGRKTANRIWGNAASVLVGDYLFSRAFELMVEDGSLDVLQVLSRASAVIAEGEVLQLEAAQKMDTSESTYLAVIAAKTAALFAAACEVAAILCGSGEAARGALNRYGKALGIAFQIADDALDYGANSSAMGKATGDDFRDGKMTLPVLIAVASANAQEARFWQRVMRGSRAQEEGDLDTALELLGKYQALEQTTARAQHYANEAKAALSIFPEGEIRLILEDIADFSVARGH